MLAVFIYLVTYGANTARADDQNEIDVDVVKTEHYVIWPNGVVPFYIEPNHFDPEQSLAIMTTLSLFAFRTCLKFNPVLVPPTNTQHVLVFENPNGVRKCVFNTEGHQPDGPHKITLGYDCMKSPQIEMMVMRALGFSFEHNRASRDLFIDVQFENIDPSAVELFTKESKLPPELRLLGYDVNSATHFGERDFSKNGHRTIIFKDHTVKQNRIGLSDLDIRKIEVVYGPECLTRERQEKFELCQNYPGVARRKREAAVPLNVTNLRVNREITPPPEILKTPIEKAKEVTEETAKLTTVEDKLHPLAQLGIESEAREIVDKINRLSKAAFSSAREKYCNDTKKHLRSGEEADTKVVDPLGALDLLTKYARTITHHTTEDTESFCNAPDSVEKYIARCGFDDKRCRQAFMSTNSRYRFSTEHRPPYPAFTKHPSHGRLYDPIYRRSNNTDAGETKVRKKRDTATVSTAEPKDDKDKEKSDKLKSDKVKSDKVKNDKVKSDKIKNDKVKSDKGKSDKVKSDKVKSDKVKSDKVKSNKVKIDKVKSDNKDDSKVVKEAKTDSPSTPKVEVESNAINSTSVTKKKATDGRRRFRDSPFSVYRRSKGDKEGAYASDVSMEAKHKKRFKKIKSQSKHKSPKKTKRVHARGEAQTGKRRNKREAMSVTLNLDDGNKIVVNKTILALTSRAAIKPYQGTSKRIVSTEPPKVGKKRRFDDNPFNIFKRKLKDGENYGSDVSLEAAPKKEIKKSVQMRKKMAQTNKKDKNERSARKKRDVIPSPSSVQPEVKVDKPKPSGVLPVIHVTQGDHNSSARIANETLIHGIRRFRDSPFSVYKLKKNDKKYMYASDLSLENKGEKKFRKFKLPKKKASLTKKSAIGVTPRGDAELTKVRGKRQVDLDSSVEVLEDGVRNIMMEKAVLEDRRVENVAKRRFKIVSPGGDVELSKAREKREVDVDRSSMEVVEDGERNVMIEKEAELGEDEKEGNETIVPKRRFKMITLSTGNMNHEKDVYQSDLSLESNTEFVFKSPKPFPKVKATNVKKKRAKARSMEIKPLGASKQVSHRPAFKTVKLTKKNEEFYADRKWPDGVVRYMIKDIPKYDIEDVRYRLEEVNKILKEKTCVYLLEIKKEDRSLFEDYLMLDNTPDYVTGRVGGKQHFGVTELFEGGQHRQHAAMVVMSMLGFYFEPSRHDRDRYIRVHPRHIRADKLHHFEPLRPDATLPLPYDYKSATHPPWQFWRHFGKTGISSLATYKDQDPEGSIMKSLGHHSKLLSDLDIVKINSVYGVRCFRENERKERTI